MALLRELKQSDYKFKIIKDLGRLYPNINSIQKARYAIFECPDCGNHFTTMVRLGKHGGVKGCGCVNKTESSLRLSKIKHKHGFGKTRLYRIWHGMRHRINNTKDKHYKDYGGRGINICTEWHVFTNFREWALKNKYKDNLQIDRVDNDGNYEPSNCRWTTKTIQAQNTRRLSSTNTSGYRGVSKDSNGKWVVTICTSGTVVRLGTFKCRLKGAYARERYIIDNNLEHTKNF